MLRSSRPPPNPLGVRLSKKEYIPVEALLVDPNLPSAIKLENGDLLAYLVAPDPSRSDNPPVGVRIPPSFTPDDGLILHTLVDWALTDFWNPDPAPGQGYVLYQANRNASTFLSAPSVRLRRQIDFRANDCDDRYFYDKIESFINSDYARHPIFSGHFERIVLNLLQSDSEWISDPADFLPALVKCCVTNIDVLSYRHLLTQIAIEYASLLDEIPDYGLEGVLREILREGARQTFTIYHHGTTSDLPPPFHPTPRVSKSEMAGPVNILRKPIRPSPATLLYDSFVYPDEAGGFLDRTLERQEEVGYDPEADAPVDLAQLRALELISSVQSILAESVATYELLQTEGLFRLLLTIGIYADALSLISTYAFRLAKVVAFGNPEIDPASRYFELIDIINEYARDFVFSPKVTPQMVSAFPIFWNYRYRELHATDGVTYEDLNLPIVDCGLVVDHVKHRRPKGRTPLELYGRFALYEPSDNQRLATEVVSVLKWYTAECNKVRLREEIGDYAEYQREVLKMDIVLFDFIRTKFFFGKHKHPTDISVIKEALPLAPTDEYFGDAGPALHRAPVNGAAFELGMVLIDSQMFQFKHEVGPLMDLAPEIPVEVVGALLKYREILEDLDLRGKLSPEVEVVSPEVEPDDDM